MKILLAILSFIVGGWMLADGLYVMMKSKYMGPKKPGPWATIFYKLNIDVFKMGPLFVVYGLVWLMFTFGIATNQNWAFLLGIIISILSLWYLPVGTILSLAILVILWKNR